MNEDEALQELFDLAGEWLDEPTIQRRFTRLFGSPVYKPAMDRLRADRSVEHRYIDRNSKKFWQYRLR